MFSLESPQFDKLFLSVWLFIWLPLIMPLVLTNSMLSFPIGCLWWDCQFPRTGVGRGGAGGGVVARDEHRHTLSGSEI